MIIKDAHFVSSNTKFDLLPKDNLPEYAFIGRSNVGKSSLINALVQRRGLAKTSATPGKTIAINHFLVNNSWFLVDLPGYGYAQRSKKAREEWRVMLANYFKRRREMKEEEADLSMPEESAEALETQASETENNP